MHYSFLVQEPYRSLILSGQKTVEGRLNQGKFAQLKIWDHLKFEDTSEEMEVINLTSYPTFQSMLENEWLKHVLPWIQDIQEGVALYYQFYTPVQESEFGVLAIEIKILFSK